MMAVFCCFLQWSLTGLLTTMVAKYVGAIRVFSIRIYYMCITIFTTSFSLWVNIQFVAPVVQLPLQVIL
ncbi:hypothetical protein F5884DRAFT_780970 [Xylogone sp. PMI_703]|nr:hypothetical protein F5884DRAFT_780970 [Xylogone sp. PMI_703]